MELPLELQEFQLDDLLVQVYVPQAAAVQQHYEQRKKQDPQTPFPYWAKVWPASIALCRYLLQHTELIKDKRVLELAAGLGLPSLVAAPYAKEVVCSDYLPEAVDVVRRSVAQKGFENIRCAVLNWHHLPADLTTDVLLLSDINYDPQEFEVLYSVLTSFLQKGTTVVLTTPQRLMAKPFIERLLPWCTDQQEICVELLGQPVATSVLVLKGAY